MAIKKKNIQTVISIPSGLSQEFKTELGLRIVSEVQDRTKSGIDKNGKPFKGYSKSYKDSRDFEIAGKSNTVNLEQTGDTLAEMEVLSIGESSITIGYSKSYEGAGQVHGIVTGEFGQKKAVTARRDFIGLPNKVVNRIVAEMRNDPQFREAREESNAIVNSILQRFLSE